MSHPTYSKSNTASLTVIEDEDDCKRDGRFELPEGAHEDQVLYEVGQELGQGDVTVEARQDFDDNCDFFVIDAPTKPVNDNRRQGA